MLADDHPLMVRGLRDVLATDPSLRVVGEARDGTAVLEAVERLKPDVAIVDLMMPGLNGIEVVRQSARRSPRTRIIILSMHAAESYVLEALRAGARGYVLKECTDTDLVDAVRLVAEGGRYLSSPLSERALEFYLERASPKHEDPVDSLSLRERQVLEMVVQGHSDLEIGAALGISPRTAETHRGKLMRKLGARSRSDLAHFSLQRGATGSD